MRYVTELRDENILEKTPKSVSTYLSRFRDLWKRTLSRDYAEFEGTRGVTRPSSPKRMKKGVT
jgi:hypothetical protein